MKIENVKRNTKIRQVRVALAGCGACRSARHWARDMERKFPKMTAEGLWRACPMGEWMAWVVECINEREMRKECLKLFGVDGSNYWDEETDAGKHYRAHWTKYAKPIEDMDYKIDPNSQDGPALESANKIRETFESPWLR